LNEPLLVAGTRPELIKMAPVIFALKRLKVCFKFLHSGQHYDYGLSQSFIDQLELPQPDCELAVKADNPAALTGEVVTRTAGAIRSVRPSLVLVQGDTNTALAATIAALKEKVPVGHVESGLRSYDWRMPEEHNRRMIDHVSDYLFAPTKTAYLNLQEEKTRGIKHITGNTVIDSTIHYAPKAEYVSRISERLLFKEYVLVTAHRAENVDSAEILREFAETLQGSPLPVVFPVHPRTLKRFRDSGLLERLLSDRNIQLLPPVGYFDFLVLMKRSSLILTDSGGIQEEATSPSIRKRVVVMRDSTERPEAVGWGFARIAGTGKENIVRCITQSLSCDKKLPARSPFGDGSSGEQIARLVQEITTLGHGPLPIPSQPDLIPALLRSRA